MQKNKKKMVRKQSSWQLRSLRTTAHLIKLVKKKDCLTEKNNAQKVHMTMKEVKPYVTLQSFSILVSEVEMLLDDAL